MATTFPTPPTFANPVVVNPSTGENQFSPIWLQWFLVLASFLSGSQFGRIRDFIPVTSTGTYVPSNGTNNVLAFLWGGGGSGGSSAITGAGQASVGGGGGAGAMCFGLLTSGFNNVPFTLGAGGFAGANGGSTTFATLSASGGLAGPAGGTLSSGFTLPGQGGSSTSGGLLSGVGNKGEQGIVISPGAVASGAGANSPWGQGGLPVYVDGPGLPATGFASGGSGAVSAPNNLLGNTGGTGAIGCGLILELS